LPFEHEHDDEHEHDCSGKQSYSRKILAGKQDFDRL